MKTGNIQYAILTLMAVEDEIDDSLLRQVIGTPAQRWERALEGLIQRGTIIQTETGYRLRGGK
jgi:hypothetical protein